MFSVFRKKAFCRKATFAVVPFLLAGLLFASCEQPNGPTDGSNPANAQQPVISTQPSGGTWDVSVRETLELKVEAGVTDGGKLSYQWYSNSSASNTGGSVMNGKTAASLTLNKTDYTANGSYYYYVVVTNTNNKATGNKTASTTSKVITVQVSGVGGDNLVNAQPPAITTQPAGGEWDVTEKETFQLTVGAGVTDGGTLSYQWYSTDSSTNTTDGSVMNGKTDAALTLNKTDYTANGPIYFYVVVTNTIEDNGEGGEKTASTTSSVATVNVNGAGGVHDTLVTFLSVTANGGDDGLPVTTELTLTFDKAIPGLSANDISLSGIILVTKGTLIGNGPVYTLPISDVPFGGTMTVAVAKTGYSINDSSKTVTISGNPVYQLFENLWMNGNVPYYVFGSVDYYSISVTGPGTYYVWWNDKDEGPVPKDMTGNVEVEAFFSNGSRPTGWASAADKGWNTPKSFTTTGAGTVYLRVTPYGPGDGGTYGIVFSTVNTRPGNGGPPATGDRLENGVWENGEITSGGSVGYTFAVESGKTYYVWWNDSGKGPTPRNKTGDILVSARYDGEATYIFGGGFDPIDNGWGDASFFTADRTGIVSLEVIALIGRGGTFGIAFSTAGVRPGAVVSSVALSANEWKDGDIGIDDVHEYKINVTQNQTYYIWWDDKSTNVNPQSLGTGTKTADVQVRASYGDESIIFVTGSSTYYGQWADVAWATPRSFTATQNGTVSVRLRPFSDPYSIGTYAGTYGIAYSTGSTRPVKEGATLISVTGNGSSGTPTSELTLTFDKIVSGLSAADITLSMTGPFGVTKGTLSGGGPSYKLGVSAPMDGTLTVTVGNSLLTIIGSPKTVGIYGDGSIIFKTLVEDEWADGDLQNAGDIDWYKITVTAGTTYYVWWNERTGYLGNYGNGDKTADVVVSAWRADGTNIFGSTNADGDHGWTDPKTISPSATDGTVYVRVRPYYDDSPSNLLGTYGVVYSTVNSRPIVPIPPDIPVTLSSVTANGVSATTSLTLTFDKAVSGLSGSDITLTLAMPGPFSVSKGTLSGDGPIYTLPIGSPIDGSLTVTVAKSGYDISGSTKTVNIYGDGSVKSLVENQWADGEFKAVADTDWYKINVTAGTEYYLWWNERPGTYNENGDGVKTGDVVVGVWKADGTLILGGTTNTEDAAWGSPKTFTASATDSTVYVRVRTYGTNSTLLLGTYGIVYSTVNSKPAVPTIPVTLNSVTQNGESGTATTALTLNFDKAVTGLVGSDITVTLAKPGPFTLTRGTLSGDGPIYTLPISSPIDGTLTVTVSKPGYTITGATKTVNIYSNGSVSVNPLVENKWEDGSLGATTDVYWYKFDATAGTAYYVWWNKVPGGFGSNGDGTKTADVVVGAWRDNGTIIFGGTNTTVNNGWGTPQTIPASDTAGTVYVRVRVYSTGTAGSLGTYGVVYSSANSRPAVPSTPVTLNSVTPNGGSGTPTTTLTLTFSEAVTGLSGSDITLSLANPGPFSVTKGTLSGSGPSYTLSIIGVRIDGSLTVTVAKPGYTITGSPKTVNIYGDGSVKPLVENQWEDGNLPAASSVDWYSFAANTGTTYRIWWNDRNAGPTPKNKGGDVVVGAWRADGTNIFGNATNAVDAGWDTAQSFTPTVNTTVYVRVMPYSANSLYIGTYGVVYSAGTTRPAVPDTPVTLNSVTQNGGSGTPTTTLTLTFDKVITGLSAGDITLSIPGPFGATRGTLSGSGPSYTLGVSTPMDGTLTVTVAKNGYVFTGSPKTVNIYGDGSVKPLVENQWADGNLPAASSFDWYSFAANAGTTYRIWWNDREDGPTPKNKTADVAVGAWYADGTKIFEAVDAGWTTAQLVAPTVNTTVYVKVIPYYAGASNVGTYGVAYSAGTTRPALSVTLNSVTANGESGTPTTALTLTFSGVITGLSADDITLSMGGSVAAKGTLSGSGPSYTLGVSTPMNGSLTVTVAKSGYNITGSSKTVNIYGSATQLVENEWENGYLPERTGADWYSFAATAGTTYRIWWNDKDAGPTPKNKTADVAVGAWRADGTNIFGGGLKTEDRGWDNAWLVDLDVNTTVYVKIMIYDENANNAGTYGVVFSTGDTRPDVVDVPVTLSNVTQNGVSGTPTTTLTLIFDKAIPGLVAGDITLSMPGPFTLTKGTFSGSGPSYTLVFGSPVDGTLTVTVSKIGYNITGSPKTVNIYGNVSVKTLVENEWANGNVPSASSVEWYSFAATAGTTYSIWWNDKDRGDNTKGGDVVVGAWRANGTNIFGGTASSEDRGWDSAQSFTPTENTTVFVRVTPYNAISSYAGTYGIVFSTGSTRPAL